MMKTNGQTPDIISQQIKDKHKRDKQSSKVFIY